MNSLYGTRYGTIECQGCGNKQIFIGHISDKDTDYMTSALWDRIDLSKYTAIQCGLCGMYQYHPIHLRQLK